MVTLCVHIGKRRNELRLILNMESNFRRKKLYNYLPRGKFDIACGDISHGVCGIRECYASVSHIRQSIISKFLSEYPSGFINYSIEVLLAVEPSKHLIGSSGLYIEEFFLIGIGGCSSCYSRCDLYSRVKV